MVSRDRKEGGMGSSYLMGIEFQFCELVSVLVVMVGQQFGCI